MKREREKKSSKETEKAEREIKKGRERRSLAGENERE